MERLVQFTFLGQNYKVFTGNSEEEIEEILAFIHRIMDETTSEGRERLPVGKAAVMVSLNVASKYIQLKQEFDQYRIEMEERIGSLNDQIDTSLVENRST